MKFNLNKEGGIKVNFIYEDGKEDIKVLKDKKLFKGALNEIYYAMVGEKVEVFLGLGKKESFDREVARTGLFQLGKSLIGKGYEEVSFDMPFEKDFLKAAVEGLIYSEYSFDFKTSKEDDAEDVELTCNIKGELSQDELDEILRVMNGVTLTRELVNNPANIVTPSYLADTAKKELGEKVEVTVLGREEIEKIGMEAYLSVAKGSSEEPKMIIMKYMNNPESDEVFGLVGKGITYDSGGYSLKPTPSMVDMFSDMGGAGTVIGTMKVISESGLKTNVIGLVCACENMISGAAYKPGDVIGSLAGKTIEITNTDAEGRLTLADAVTYMSNDLNATRVIDLATLTGACLVALGEEYTAAVTNDEDFLGQVLKSSKDTDENMWQLPNSKVIGKDNDSKVADIRNAGGRFGGTISAGLFIEAFLKEGTPWVHLDIAGTAYLSKPNRHLIKGATGVHVKTLYNLVKNNYTKL